MSNPLVIVASVFALSSLIFLRLAARARRRKHGRLRGIAAHGTLAVLMLTAALLFSTLAVSTWGYRALTYEEVVLILTTTQTGALQFDARVEFPDGHEETFALSGDEFYVDARILKWKPVANLLGLHTDYELDRISGRYLSLTDERTRARTIHALGADKPVDLFQLRRSYPLLALLVDAEYGSATFIVAEDHGRFEVRLSTTGLLVRAVPQEF